MNYVLYEYIKPFFQAIFILPQLHILWPWQSHHNFFNSPSSVNHLRVYEDLRSHEKVHWVVWNWMPFIFLQSTQFNIAYSTTISLIVAGKPLHAILCLMGNDAILVTMGCSMRAYRYKCVGDWVKEVHI
jgi:hypothetical protein